MKQHIIMRPLDNMLQIEKNLEQEQWENLSSFSLFKWVRQPF